ncbi:hypothetical protein AKJ44_01325 [candidate division MSBL1 archaeon SCGC-AAA261F17]|uniref:MAGE domain-containing protein n=1 Tax=candidate division MSBL1 archaeon SCGC-AAA261F17 TaxID=1698274 RepID=A0A133V6R3_9EURY|nr:hypothetical protein AKJ44_01325 [candidate division MSBL1 archaeon SCGC-AAA261F17]
MPKEEKTEEEIEEERIEAIREKMGRAAQLILFKHHRQPGAKSWELKRALGKKYPEIVKMLDQELQKIGLTIKEVSEGEDKPARYYATMAGHPRLSDRTFGWRIDDMAALVITLSYIQSKRGGAPEKEVKEILREKFPKWRVNQILNKFTKKGYISEDDEGILYIDWRTRAEIDQKELLGRLIGKEGELEDVSG